MRVRSKKMRILLYCMLVCCILLLFKFVLFKQPFAYYRSYFRHQYSMQSIREGMHKANLRPFSTIRLFYKARSLRTEYKYKNIGGNIVGFLPLGIFLPLLFSACRRWSSTVLTVFGISLFFETMQLLGGIGVFDVDDLILNTAGGLLGYLITLAAWKLVQYDITVRDTAWHN